MVFKRIIGPNGLKFAENVYFKFDINNSKEFQSTLIENNNAAKDDDLIYEFPNEIFEVISNKKRFYYSKKMMVKFIGKTKCRIIKISLKIIL